MAPYQVAAWLGSHYRHIAVFEAYFDESGDPADKNLEVFALAWVVAPANNWKKFSIAWNRILRRYKIDVMHMKEYEHRIEQFKGWDLHKKEVFAAQLAGVLKLKIELAQSHCMSTEIWDKSIAPEMGSNFRKTRGPYIFLLQSCLESLVEYGQTSLPKGERIACIFDENKLMSGKKPLFLGAAGEHYAGLKRARGWDNILGGITFESKRDFVPLQAADMLAYEGYKDMVNIVEGSPRPRRKLLTNLMQSKRIELAVIDAEGFWKEVKQNKKQS